MYLKFCEMGKCCIRENKNSISDTLLIIRNQKKNKNTGEKWKTSFQDSLIQI